MKKNNLLLPIILLVVLTVCCCLLLALMSLGYGIYEFGRNIPTIEPWLPYPGTPTPFEITRQPVDQANESTLIALENTIVPDRDLAVLACRFHGVCNMPETIDPPAIPLTVGSTRQFWLLDSDTGEYSRISANLEYLTPHVYFWVQEDIAFDRQDAENLIDTFETRIYPTNRAFFGSEWTPGVDNDEHLYIIYANNLGANVAGFFISLDEYNPLVVEHSNGIEAFYIDSSQDLGDEYTYSTLAHEFQHMIHWYQDANESSFLDEGFAELAVLLNGYYPGGFDWVYSLDPDIPLTDWRDSGDNDAHYGANFLFVTYFLDRFGDEVTQALIHDQKNELDSVDNTLAHMGINDPHTNQPVTADDFFLDWVITNFILDPGVGDGRYYYDNYPDAPRISPTETIYTCPQDEIFRTVNQYGVDYIQVSCEGEYTIDFTGATLTPLLPVDPHSGDYAFWSHKTNESNTTLTHEFDFSGVTGSISLSYWAWYDLEENYDYVYLEASTDGEEWEILVTPSGTGDNPTGSSYGWGYNGNSSAWVEETVDLSHFAGQRVFLRFDYITDAAVINEGFLVDDIAIPEIDYFDDFEADDGGWEASGFVRIRNILPQTYRLALIQNVGQETFVDIISLDDDQTVSIPVSILGGDDVVLVVAGTTRFTMEVAPYTISIH